MCDALRPRYRKEPEQMAPAVMEVMQGLLEPIGLISPTIHGLGTGAMKDPVDGQLSFVLSLGGRVIKMAIVRQELKVCSEAGQEVIDSVDSVLFLCGILSPQMNLHPGSYPVTFQNAWPLTL